MIKSMKNIFKSNKKENLTNRIASDIGYAILNNFNGDYDKTYNFLNDCKFTNIQAKKRSKKVLVYITLSRPGLIIGKRGKTINYIQDYLKENNNGVDVTINLKETKRWSYFLYPMTWDKAKEIGGF